MILGFQKWEDLSTRFSSICNRPNCKYKMMMWRELTAAMATESEIIYLIPPLSAFSLYTQWVREVQQICVLQLFVDTSVEKRSVMVWPRGIWLESHAGFFYGAKMYDKNNNNNNISEYEMNFRLQDLNNITISLYPHKILYMCCLLKILMDVFKFFKSSVFLKNLIEMQYYFLRI